MWQNLSLRVAWLIRMCGTLWISGPRATGNGKSWEVNVCSNTCIPAGTARQHTATWQHTPTHCNTLQHGNILQHTAIHCNTLQHIATHCNNTCLLRGKRVQQHMYTSTHSAAAYCNTATYCNTLQYTACHVWKSNVTHERASFHIYEWQHTATQCHATNE